jgi:uncharacterized membrane protein YhhN
MVLRRILILIYIIVGMVEVLGEVLNSKPIIYLSKPLLMPLLAILLFKMVNMSNGKGHKLILSALVFSLTGDVLLMIRPGTEGLFISGLFAFLVGHICYFLAFRSDTSTPFSSKWSLADYVIPVLLAWHSIVIGSLMFNNLHGVMTVAVLLYVAVITLMGISASLRTRDGFTLDRVGLLGGVLMFILSDTLIGVTRFIDPDIPFARPSIMILYITGQLTIVLGWASKKVWVKPEISSSNA